MGTTTKQRMFEARIWEPAEQWTFDAKIKASSEEEARELLKRIYPPKAYRIVHVG